MAKKDKNPAPKNEETDILLPAGQGPWLWFALLMVPILLALYFGMNAGLRQPEPEAAVEQPEAAPQSLKRQGTRGRIMDRRGQ